MQTSRREAPRGAPLNTFELHLCLLGMDVLGLACGYASVYSRIWVSPLSSSSHPTLEVLCRDPFSEGHLWASGLYYLHFFAATIFKYIQSKYASVNAVSKRGWPRGSPARSALGCREAQSTRFPGSGRGLGAGEGVGIRVGWG